MPKYRIITEPGYDGTPRYRPQKKKMWFWLNMSRNCMNMGSADEYIQDAIRLSNFKSEVAREYD